MLKTRIIPTLLYKNHGLVKGVGFDSWRRIGTALPAIKVYGNREVDELILLDIAATEEGRLIDSGEVDHLADECFMPLTVGGGVRTVNDFYLLLRAGADKISVNSGALERPKLIDDASKSFGAQCVVVSIDFKRIADGHCEVFGRSGSLPSVRSPVAWAKEVTDRGAGEILLTSIDRDGTLEGYDVELTQEVADSVSVPVIASGGAGCYDHMLEAIHAGHAAAVAAASLFHFTEQTPLEAKLYLNRHGIHTRI